VSLRKQADALKVYLIPDACLLVMAQRPARFRINNLHDQAKKVTLTYSKYLLYVFHRMGVHWLVHGKKVWRTLADKPDGLLKEQEGVLQL
jgi:hypothetical protein